MKCYYKFYSAFLNGQLLLRGVARTPKLISYYAANLNSDMPTVKSANPNARLLAFISLAVTSCQLDKLHISLHARRS